jgi:hypothetical protein
MYIWVLERGRVDLGGVYVVGLVLGWVCGSMFVVGRMYGDGWLSVGRMVGWVRVCVVVF